MDDNRRNRPPVDGSATDHAEPVALPGYQTAPEQPALFGGFSSTLVHTLETSRQAPPPRLPDTYDLRYDSPRLASIVRTSERMIERAQIRAMAPMPFVEPASSDEVLRRHGWWKDERAQVRAAMSRCGFPAARLERFDQCGSASFVLIEKRAPYRHRRACNKCRDRNCKPCQIERANKYAGNLRRRLEQYKGRLQRRFRFVTLTLRSNTEPLPVQLRNFSASFAKLRRIRLCDLRKRKMFNWWDRYVVGGAYFGEATLNEETGLWHVHAHLIVEGQFLPQDELSSLWAVATGGSTIVDVRALSGVDEAAAELVKYASKGAEAKLRANGDKLVEWMIGTKGVRFCSTFGTWRGFRLAASDEKFVPEDWVNVGREDDIRRRAALGDAWAIAVIRALERDAERRLDLRGPPKAALVVTHG